MGDFLRILGVETLQNIPLWMGFIVGIRLYERNKALGVVILFGCMLLGAFLISATEHLIIGGPSTLATNPQGLLTNALIFCVIGAIFLAYFTNELTFINYGSDVALGFLAGFLIAVMQGVSAGHPVGDILTHGLSLALAVAITLAAVRFIATQESLPLVVAQAFGVTVVASLIITVIDYAEYIA